MTENPVHCSFCHKSQHDVTKVVAGDGVFICNECIDLASGSDLKPSSPLDRLRAVVR